MEKDYKAVPYQVTKPAEDEYSFPTRETRYCIVSEKTGEVLDDAQGYGYKTAKKAYAGYAYKNRDKSKDAAKEAKKKEILQWMKEHKSFVRDMDDVAFQIAKGSWGPDDRFDAVMVAEMLEGHGLEPDFSANDLYRVWAGKYPIVR